MLYCTTGKDNNCNSSYHIVKNVEAKLECSFQIIKSQEIFPWIAFNLSPFAIFKNHT